MGMRADKILSLNAAPEIRNSGSLIWRRTQRAVSGMPSLSFSSGSNMPRATASSPLLSAMMGKGSAQLADSSQLYARMSWLVQRHKPLNCSQILSYRNILHSVIFMIRQVPGGKRVVQHCAHSRGENGRK